MFSFFKSKKPSPSSSPESEPIPSADSEFVVVDPRNRDPSQPGQSASSIYPNFDRNFGLPASSLPAAGPMNPVREPAIQHINYLHGIPFKLSSELSTGDSNEITKIQIDDILAIITSKLEVSAAEYDFGLERSIISQELTDC